MYTMQISYFKKTPTEEFFKKFLFDSVLQKVFVWLGDDIFKVYWEFNGIAPNLLGGKRLPVCQWLFVWRSRSWSESQSVTWLWSRAWARAISQLCRGPRAAAAHNILRPRANDAAPAAGDHNFFHTYKKHIQSFKFRKNPLLKYCKKWEPRRRLVLIALSKRTGCPELLFALDQHFGLRTVACGNESRSG